MSWGIADNTSSLSRPNRSIVIHEGLTTNTEKNTATDTKANTCRNDLIKKTESVGVQADDHEIRDDFQHRETTSISVQTDDYGMTNGDTQNETESIQTDDQIVEDELQHSTETACHRKMHRKRDKTDGNVLLIMLQWILSIIVPCKTWCTDNSNEGDKATEKESLTDSTETMGEKEQSDGVYNRRVKKQGRRTRKRRADRKYKENWKKAW